MARRFVRVLAALLCLLAFSAEDVVAQSLADFVALDVVTYPQNTAIIIVGAWNGFYRSLDNGNTWQNLRGATFYRVAIHPFDPNVLFGIYPTALLSDNLIRSTDGGLTWNVIRTGNPHLSILHMSSNGVLFTATGPLLMRSIDSGSTWDTIRTPVAQEILSLALSGRDSSLFYLGSNTGVYKSSDGGRSWDSLGLAEYDRPFVVAVDPRSVDTVYAATKYGSSFFKSTDGGSSWVLKDSTFEPIRHLLMKAADPDHLFIGTDSGTVMYSPNGGNSWGQFGPKQGFRIDAMWLDTTSGGRLLLGGREYLGIKILDLTTGVKDESQNPVSVQCGLHPNYPDPFNSTTMIGYTLASRQRITLRIFDILGRSLKVLVECEQLAGRHEVLWDATDGTGHHLPSGIYFCVLMTGTSASVERIVLTR